MCDFEFGSQEHIDGLSREALESDFRFVVDRMREAEGEWERLERENAKLRELVRDMQHAIACLVVLGDAYVERHEDELCAFDDRMRELGVEP